MEEARWLRSKRHQFLFLVVSGQYKNQNESTMKWATIKLSQFLSFSHKYLSWKIKNVKNRMSGGKGNVGAYRTNL